MKKEIWKDIPGYEGLYQVSSFGRVYSLPREWIAGNNGSKRKHDGKILKPSSNKDGYLTVILYKNKKRRYIKLHQLVAMAFLDHIPCNMEIIVDHKDDNPSNNKLYNLQLITQRENCLRVKEGKGYTSCLRGIYFHKSTNKWRCQIKIKGKTTHLGLFTNEERAAEVYQLALKNIHLYDGDAKKFRALISSL